MYTYTIAGLLALAAGANAGVCGNVNSAFASNQRQQECVSLGCRWTGSCAEPSECRDGDRVVYDGRSTGLTAIRKPVSSEIARLCDYDDDCTAIYRVDLNAQFTTGPPNCNDIGMLPPHGVDQTECRNHPDGTTNNLFRGVSLTDYTGHPFVNDGVKQSVAASKNAVTAITEDTDDCFSNGNSNCAFPLGFYADTILKNKKICVQVRNVQDKWVEIMAASRAGSDASFCVRDRNKDDAANGDKGCTQAGDLIDVRESGQSKGTDNMYVEFFTEDNYDDANIDIHWRIAASMIETRDPSSNEDPDAEDWAQHRDGADYPLSLMKPYPEGYDGEPVFEVQGSSSGSYTSPTFFVVLVAAIVAAFC